jgi:DNA-binding PadR family transcriptional regulator
MHGYGMRRHLHGPGFEEEGNFGRFAGPHGMGHGPGGRGGFFPHGRRREHLIPTLLILLRKEPLHGYALLKELEAALPHAGAMPDVSSVYRALGELEHDGAVVSHWQAGDGGGRRVYELTPVGEEMVESWLVQLEEQHRRLGQLIERARK